MTYPSSQWYNATPSPPNSLTSESSSNCSSPRSTSSTSSAQTSITIPTVGEEDLDIAPPQIVSRLPATADHTLLFIGDSPEIEQLATYLVVVIGDSRTVKQMKQVLRARELVEMWLYYAGYERFPTPLNQKHNPKSACITTGLVEARLEYTGTVDRGTMGILKSEFIHHARCNLRVFGSYLNCRIPHYSPHNAPRSGFVTLSSPGPREVLEVLGRESRQP
ncbi:hypothetical protein BGX38DRAFT_868988 [Terfezia claveryi]|nr:hypothetical protein BGX38DRAFT_868988 [Terfezia claveryi]